MTQTDQSSASVTAVDGSARLAGALLSLVGLLNVAFGVLSLGTDQVRLSPAVAGGLLVAGLLTVAVGALVWRGNRGATIGALTVFAMLLVFQLSEAAAGGGAATAGGLAEGPATRFGVLTVLVVTLGVAAWRLRRRPGR